MNAISVILRNDIEIIGAGRTDTGVSAATMVAHFDADNIDPVQLCYKLNRFLPPTIAIQKILPVKSSAHARFDATSRTYHYNVYTQKDPFKRHYAYKLNTTVNFQLMNEAAMQLLDVRDFTSFSKLHTDAKTNICKVMHAEWKEISPDLWQFEITADRFLRNMVRAIVGTLLEVGRGTLSIEAFKQVIEAKNRCAAAESVPGNALSLVNVTYPEEIFDC